MNSRMMIRALAALALLALPAAARADGPATATAEAIAQMVDVRSFRSSIGPRLEDDLKTFADYGFTDATVVDDKVVELYEPDRWWVFTVTILEAEGERTVLCIHDQALGGPTYNAQKPLAFAPGGEGLLVATDEIVENPACPTFPESG